MFAKKIFGRFTSKRRARSREDRCARMHEHERIARCIAKASNGAACMRDAHFCDAIIA